MRAGDENDTQNLAPPGKRRRFRLTDARGVRRELAALYAELRNGEVDTTVAKVGATVLRAIMEAVELSDVETRLQALEAKR